MKAKERRKKILKELENSNKYLKGTSIGEKYGVSRQVIVQDIAILKAEGNNIIATPQGYILNMSREIGLIKRIAVKHNSQNIDKELGIIVANKGRILDVTVEHNIYGDITGKLNIETEEEVDEFIEKVKKEPEKLLLNLTGGIHNHRIEVSSEKAYENILEELKKEKILVE